MNISRLSLALCAFVFLAQARHVHAGPREDFDRLVQEAQATPADDKLRERIIAAALALKPAPAVPIEARRHMSRAQGAIELAKQPEDMRLAVEELEKALRLAPWWAEAYYNLGVVQDKAGRYGDAVRSLRLYLRTAPGAKDAQDVEMQIAKLEFKAEQSSPAAKASREQQGFEVLKKSLEGAVFVGRRNGSAWMEARVKNGEITYGVVDTDPEMIRLNPQLRDGPSSIFLPIIKGRAPLRSYRIEPFGLIGCGSGDERPATAILDREGNSLTVKSPCTMVEDKVLQRRR